MLPAPGGKAGGLEVCLSLISSQVRAMPLGPMIPLSYKFYISHHITEAQCTGIRLSPRKSGDKRYGNQLL